MKVNLLNRNTSFCKLCILQRQLEATSMCTIEINKIEITIRLIEIDISLTLTIPGHVESSHAPGWVGRGRSPHPWIMTVYYGLNYGCKGSVTKSPESCVKSRCFWQNPNLETKFFIKKKIQPRHSFLHKRTVMDIHEKSTNVNIGLLSRILRNLVIRVV